MPEWWSAFYGQFMDLWGFTFAGMSVGHYVAGIGVMLGIFIIRRLFANIILTRLEKLTASTETDLDDKLLDALENPLKFIPIVIGVFFFGEYFNLHPEVYNTVMALGRSLSAFVVFWAAYNIVDPLSVYIKKAITTLTKKSDTGTAKEFIGLLIKAMHVAIFVVGVISILAQWGVNVGPLLASLGVFGMAGAFAARDTIANIFGGVKLLFDGAFRSGHWIQTPSVEGTVLEIGIATTKIQEFDKAITSVPNSVLANQPIKNWSKMNHRRIKMNIGLVYRTTKAQAENILKDIREYIANHKDIADPDNYPVSQMVHLVELGDHSININLYYFTKTTDWKKWREIREENMLDFIGIVENHGSALAFPSQSLYIEQSSEGKES